MVSVTTVPQGKQSNVSRSDVRSSYAPQNYPGKGKGKGEAYNGKGSYIYGKGAYGKGTYGKGTYGEGKGTYGKGTYGKGMYGKGTVQCWACGGWGHRYWECASQAGKGGVATPPPSFGGRGKGKGAWQPDPPNTTGQPTSTSTSSPVSVGVGTPVSV